MSTRSITRIFNGHQELCRIYKHYDGHPLGWGSELAEFLMNLDRSNPTNHRLRHAGYIAVDLLAHFGKQFEDIELQPTTWEDSFFHDHNYEYRVYASYDKGIELHCLRMPLGDDLGDIVGRGTPQQMFDLFQSERPALETRLRGLGFGYIDGWGWVR